MADYQQGYSLDQRFYTDPDIYELELERVVYRNWILAGHVSEFREPGDFKVFKVARESAIIVRGKDGAIKGFANVCRTSAFSTRSRSRSRHWSPVQTGRRWIHVGRRTEGASPTDAPTRR